jgi:CRISPR-associated endonuclease Csn1
MAWRLGLDLGTNSIGWAALELSAEGAVTRLLDMGVTIFPDGREPQQGGRVGDSLAVTRRLARSAPRISLPPARPTPHDFHGLTYRLSETFAAR